MSKYRQRVAQDPVESVRERVENGQPYEATQFIQSFLARKGDKISVSELLDYVLRSAAILFKKDEHICASELVCWVIANYPLVIEHVQQILDAIEVGSSQSKAAILRALEKKEFEPLRPTIQSKLGTALADMENFPDAAKWLIKSGDIPAYAAMIIAWTSHGYPSERYMFGVRAILNLLQSGECGKAAELRSILVENDHWDVSIAPECRLCEMLFDLLPMQSQGVNQAAVFQVLQSHFSPLLLETDPKLVPVLQEIGYKLFAVPRPRQQPNLLGNIMNSLFAAR